MTKTVEDDLGSGIRTIKLRSDGGTQSIDDRGIVTSSWNNDTFFIHPDDPLSAKLVTEYAWAIKSGPSDMEAKSRTEITADADNFYLTWLIEARERGRVIHSKGATRTIKRDFC